MYPTYWHLLVIEAQRYRITIYMCPWVLNFSPFCSAGTFLSYRPFWDKFTEWFQNDLEYYKVKCTRLFLVCVTASVPEHQISSCFTLQPAGFELQAILRQVHWMTLKWPWTVKGQTYPIMLVPSIPASQFQSVSLYDQQFLNYRPFWDMHQMTSKWP